MSECNKCGETLMPGDEVLILCRSTYGQFSHETESVIHKCCDDGMSLTLDADSDDWGHDPERACEHIKRKFNIS